MKIMGHRGARHEKPENTLGGFKYIISLGLKAVELDIHLSQDGEIMVIHDGTLERTTNGNGAVSDHNLSFLQSLDAGQGEKIPTLKEVCDLLLPEGFEIQVEIKDPKTVSPLIEMLNGLTKEQLQQIIVISFDHRTIYKVKEQLPAVKTAALIDNYTLDPCSVVRAAKADGLSISIRFVDGELVDKLHAQGYEVTVWNANTKEQYEEMKKLGLDYMATDAPSEILKWAK